MQFVSLHSHSTFSYQDGYAMPEDHVRRVAELGMTALALTEHGNLSSIVKLDQAAKAHGIKPIFGLEAYVAPSNMRETKYRRKWHQVLLAMNQQGYQNLMRLVALSYSEGFFHFPTIHWEWLQQYHEGLIATSGCLDGVINAQLLGRKDLEASEHDALRRVKAYQRLFGDRFYLEVQRFPQLPDACRANVKLAEWASRLGIKLVGTADVHYPLPTDNQMQKILHAAGRGKSSVAEAEASWEYDILGTYPTSDKQILDDLKATGLSTFQTMQAFRSTAEIAERCNVELPVMARVQYPYAEDGAGSPEELIRRWLNEGWSFRGFDRAPRELRAEYRRRVERELDVFASKDFVHYFLMIADAVRFAKREGIAVGPGRGSAAASLAMYLLQVTEINPMQFPMMLFERFVDPDRADLPDVDIDFEPERRDEVRQYLVGKYGEDRVGNVGTFTYYRSKNAIQDVARVHEVPFLTAKKLKDMVLDEGIDVTVAAFPVVADLFEKFPAMKYAARLEGNVKSFGVHPAGLVVGADSLWKYTTTYSRKVGTGPKAKQTTVLSVDKYDGETMGLLKIDALGLTTIGEIRLMAETTGMTLEQVYRLPLDDDAVLNGFREGRTAGVFQFSGATTRDICVEVQPREFMDLAHINALSRPGPLYGGSTSEFIRRRQGRTHRPQRHELIEEVLAQTEGEIVYQEQVIQLAARVGGFDTVKAARVRTIISKKKGLAAFAELKADFVNGARVNGVPAEEAEQVWRGMITSGGYAFNVAHAVSYSVLAYWCMWFRVHHPVAFFYARLAYAADKGWEATVEILKDLEGSNEIRILPLDAMKSAASWTIDTSGPDSSFVLHNSGSPGKPALRPGFQQVKGIGLSQAEKLVEYRERCHDWDADWQHFIEVPGVGTKTIEILRSFAKEDDPFEVKKIWRNTLAIKADIEDPYSELRRLPKPTKTSDMIPYREGWWEGVLLGVIREITFRDLFESHRNRTGTDLDPKSVERPDLSRSASIYLEDTRGRYKINLGRFQWERYGGLLEYAVIDQDYILAEVKKSNYPGKTTSIKQMWVITP